MPEKGTNDRGSKSAHKKSSESRRPTPKNGGSRGNAPRGKNGNGQKKHQAEEADSGIFGFEEDVSVDSLPTNPICQKCLTVRDNASKMAKCVKQATNDGIQKGLISPERTATMARQGEQMTIKTTCVLICKVVEGTERMACLQAGGYKFEPEIKFFPPSNTPKTESDKEYLNRRYKEVVETASNMGENKIHR